MKAKKSYSNIRKFYYVYKITCLLGSFAGKYYIGRHQTDNLNDGYAGSGRKINNYYKKYGCIEGKTYKKEILCFCNSFKELKAKENYFVGNLYKDEFTECLNCREGGEGGIMCEESYNNMVQHNKETQIKNRRGNKEWSDFISNVNKKRYEDPNERIKTSERTTQYFKDHPEAGIKISERNIERYKDPNERIKTGEASKKVWENMSDEKRIQHSINVGIGVRNGLTNMTDEEAKLMKLHQREAKLNKKLMTLGSGMPKKYVSVELIPEYELNGWYWCDRNGNKKEIKHKQTLRESKLGVKNPMYGKHSWNSGKKGNLKTINNGIITKQVKIEELNSYLSNGWFCGKLKKEYEQLGYIKVLKNHGGKWILPEELDYYISLGYHQKVA